MYSLYIALKYALYWMVIVLKILAMLSIVACPLLFAQWLYIRALPISAASIFTNTILVMLLTQ